MVELAEMIRELRQELNCALAGGGDGPVRFELGPVEAGGEARVDSSRTHRICLTLQPKLVAPDGTHHAVLITGDEAEGER